VDAAERIAELEAKLARAAHESDNWRGSSSGSDVTHAHPLPNPRGRLVTIERAVSPRNPRAATGHPSAVLRWPQLAWPLLLTCCIGAAPQSTPAGEAIITPRGAAPQLAASNEARGSGAPGRVSPPRAVHDGSWDSCPFPPKSAVAKVDEAYVDLQIAVAPTGVAETVTVLRDPGYDFGQMAGLCAFAHRYVPAHDVDGQAVRGTMKLRIHFSRPPPASETPGSVPGGI
jgi:hypothetical protein